MSFASGSSWGAPTVAGATTSDSPPRKAPENLLGGEEIDWRSLQWAEHGSELEHVGSGFAERGKEMEESHLARKERKPFRRSQGAFLEEHHYGESASEQNKLDN